MDITKVIQIWKKDLNDDSSKQSIVHNYISDCLYEKWTPKWKCFQPPMWMIFRWAYDIRRTLFSNIYPTRISTGNEYVPGHELESTFIAQRYESETVEKFVNEFKDTDVSKPRGASAAIIYTDDNWMEICEHCYYGPFGPIKYEKGMECLNIQYCMRAYHMGHTDGILEEGGENDTYRGSFNYREKQTKLERN